MQHYDGPAFYRMNKKAVKKKKDTKRVTEKVAKNKKIKQVAKNKLGKENDRWFGGHTFRPTYVPPSVTKLQLFTSEEAKYNHLCEQLKKESETFFLFDGESEVDLSKVIILADEQNNETPETPETPETSKKVESENQVVSNNLIDSADLSKNQHLHLNEEKIDTIAINEKKPTTKSAYLLPRDERDVRDTSEQEDKVEKDTSFESESLTAKNKINDSMVAQSNNGSSVFLQNNLQAEDSSSGPIEEIKEVEVKEEGQPEAVRRLLSRSSQTPFSNSGVKQTGKVVAAEEKEHIKDKETFQTAPIAEESLTHEAVETSANSLYQKPPISLLPSPVKKEDESMDEWVLTQIDVLNETLKSFNVKASVKDWTIGPAVTQFEIVLGRGVKVNKITNLSDDLKLALAARDIRIEAPIPGKSSVGVEIPNLHSRPVMLAEVLATKKFDQKDSPLTVALGVDLFGRPQVTDLRKMPHGLIAGATGSGKSVFINSILVSLLYKANPTQVKLLLIDPKAVELAPYHDIPHLLAPVISDPAAAAAALKWAVEEMEERYQRLAAGGARNIENYNEKAEAHGEYGLKMPYIVIIIDELADLMMVASSEVQDYIARITQKARAAGIHLIIATQRPSVDVITGTIKNNIPTRVAFMVSSQVDSRTILDCSGAERLLGRGDMLYLGNGASQPVRLQGTFVENEVDQIADFVRSQGKPKYAFDPDNLKKQVERNEQEDELFPRILDYIVNEENISTSKLQRVFSIGYNRAANIIDELEQKRYISPARGSKPRDVFLTQSGLDKLRAE